MSTRCKWSLRVFLYSQFHGMSCCWKMDQEGTDPHACLEWRMTKKLWWLTRLTRLGGWGRSPTSSSCMRNLNFIWNINIAPRLAFSLCLSIEYFSLSLYNAQGHEIGDTAKPQSDDHGFGTRLSPSAVCSLPEKELTASYLRYSQKRYTFCVSF